MPKTKFIYLKVFYQQAARLPHCHFLPLPLYVSHLSWRTRCIVCRHTVFYEALAGRVLPTTQSHFPLCSASIPHYGQYLCFHSGWTKRTTTPAHADTHALTVCVDGQPPGGARCYLRGEEKGRVKASMSVCSFFWYECMYDVCMCVSG